jgi:radial spoke head protein 4A
LYLSIKKLAERLPEDVGSLRFWGRMTTMSAPYYVVEGANVEDDADDTKLQEGKDGANKYAYWVSNTLEPESWSQLPQITCNQIVSASKFKRFLTGNLASKVPSYPPFPGTEKEFLRAQIARISSATMISPQGYFKIEDPEADEKVIVAAEPEELKEMFPKPAQSLCSNTAWRHHEKELNAIGRVTALHEETDEEGEPVITVDSKVPVSVSLSVVREPAWSFRVSALCAGASDTSAVLARSLDWPGAVVVAAPTRFICVYLGSGVRFETELYKPLVPQMIDESSSPVGFTEEADPLIDPTPPPPEEPEAEEGEGEEEEPEDE